MSLVSRFSFDVLDLCCYCVSLCCVEMIQECVLLVLLCVISLFPLLCCLYFSLRISDSIASV